MMDQIAADNEYSLQYFGFTPEQFFKEFTDVILDELSAITQEDLNALSSSSADNKEELLAKVVTRHQTWTQRAESVLRDLELTIKSFFTIPKNVFLPTDYMHTHQFSEREATQLESEVRELEETYKQEVTAVELMMSELLVMDRLKPIQVKVDEAIQSLKPFAQTVEEIKQLEKLVRAFQASKRSIEVDAPAKADEEESDGYDVQWSKFATR